MSKRHKHADVIHAWADGAEIEYRDAPGRPWRSVVAPGPVWDTTVEYRIKPEVARYRRCVRRMMDGKQFVDTVCDLPGMLTAREMEFDLRNSFVRWIDTEWQEEAL
jgi:hypothetical protein